MVSVKANDIKGFEGVNTEKIETEKLKKELEELKSSYFMLRMKDTWDDSDYEHAAKLRGRIAKIELDLSGIARYSTGVVRYSKK